MTSEIRIGVLGNVDSGKSTIIGVLSRGELDNGRGKARTHILFHPHEKKTGRTSSITPIYYKNNTNNILFIDLAGHELYLKTTIHGIMGYNLDYVMLVVGSNMGFSKMSIEHLKMIIYLKIKFFIVLTKIDICPSNIKENTIESIKKFLIEHNINNNVPIISISSKTGENIDKLKIYLTKLKKIYKLSNFNYSPFFTIESKYNVVGVGTVVAGKLLRGNINKNDKLLLGPINNNFVTVVVKSLHDNFKNDITHICEGDSGCINIKNIDKKQVDLKKHKFKKSTYILQDNDIIPNVKILSWSFEAKISLISNHSTTISKNYQPVINCNKIIQTAKIIEIKNINNITYNYEIDDDKSIIRTGDISNIIFRFCYRPEIINKNDIFIFREGSTKGIGKIINVLN